MADLHKAYILRTASPYKRTLTLFDEIEGKIEGIIPPKPGSYLFHGAVISCSLKKRGTKYMLSDIKLVDAPLFWTDKKSESSLLFFHHVLELVDHFVPWNERCPALFKLVELLYVHPEKLESIDAKRRYIQELFKYGGFSPEMSMHSLETSNLNTASYLKMWKST